jgi:alanine racemase
MNLNSENFPPRPAWTEIDLGKLRRNLQLIRGDLPKHVQLMAVVKDEAYGHGALDVARVAVEEGAWGFGLSTLEEAMTLASPRRCCCSANGRRPNSNGASRMT